MIEQLNIRRFTEEREESLSPYAVKSKLSKGRAREEPLDPVRTVFQRDRDRIIHSKAFRRLKHKTQVFIMPMGDHYVTRLTHTLEVSQIGRTIARALNLNEDLTEAISLGHDLGHTPFGHAGEDALNELYKEGFHHNEQSLRIVECLEKNGRGLNLTREVRDGILNHSKTHSELFGKNWSKLNTLEGEVVRLADVVAYVNHDIGDAIRAGIITEAELPPEAAAVLGKTHSGRINTMVCDIIEASWASRGISPNDVPGIRMSPRVLEATRQMRDFLFERVYNVQLAQEETGKAREIIFFLYRYLCRHTDKLPPDESGAPSNIERRVVDNIAGMTDLYALRLADELQKRG